MPTTRGNVKNRVQALRNRHAALSAQLESELKHSAPNEIALKRLKLEKLRIKEQIAQEAQSTG